MKNQILKNIFFFIGFISLMSFAFVKDNFILWQENKKLKIQDFKAENKDTIKVNQQQFLGAISAIRIEYSSFQRNKIRFLTFLLKRILTLMNLGCFSKTIMFYNTSRFILTSPNYMLEK